MVRLGRLTALCTETDLKASAYFAFRLLYRKIKPIRNNRGEFISFRKAQIRYEFAVAGLWRPPSFLLRVKIHDKAFALAASAVLLLAAVGACASPRAGAAEKHRASSGACGMSATVGLPPATWNEPTPTRLRRLRP
jgi:hypothetical protein